MPRELVTTEQIVLGTLRCELTEPPRTNSPQGDLQARWFRTASCTGTSWGFEKGPRRSLFRFFAPLSSRRRKGNPLPSPGRRCDLRAVDNRLPTKGRWPFGLTCIKHAVVAQVPRRIPLQAMVFPKKPLALRKRAILRKRKTGLFYLALLLSSEKKVCKDWQGVTPP